MNGSHVGEEQKNDDKVAHDDLVRFAHRSTLAGILERLRGGSG
jgi:hypothetical protein